MKQKTCSLLEVEKGVVQLVQSYTKRNKANFLSQLIINSQTITSRNKQKRILKKNAALSSKTNEENEGRPGLHLIWFRQQARCFQGVPKAKFIWTSFAVFI